MAGVLVHCGIVVNPSSYDQSESPAGVAGRRALSVGKLKKLRQLDAARNRLGDDSGVSEVGGGGASSTRPRL